MRLILLLGLDRQSLDLLIRRVLDVVLVVREKEPAAEKPSDQSKRARRHNVYDKSAQDIGIVGFQCRVYIRRANPINAQYGQHKVKATESEKGHDEE